MLKFDHKGKYEIEELKSRLMEIQPSYSFHLLDSATYEKFLQVDSSIPESNRTKIPRIMYFAETESRTLDFKLITQTFRHQGVFLEIAPLFDIQHLVPGSYRDMVRPYLVVEKYTDQGQKETEIYRNVKTYAELEQSLSKSIGKIPKTM